MGPARRASRRRPDLRASSDHGTVTYHLIEDAKWSDGEPITSADVKWSLETLGEEGLLFTGYTTGVTAIKTPDEHTVVLETQGAQRPPDRRPLRLHPARAHLGQGAGGRAHRRLPARGAAGRQRPLHRHRVRAEPDPEDDAEPGVARRGTRLRRAPVHPLRQRRRGRARAHPRRGRLHPRGPAGDLRPPRRAGGDRGRERAHLLVHRARLQPLLGGELPGREVQPRDPGPDDPAGDRLQHRPRAKQRDREPRNLVRRPRSPAVVLQGLLRGPGAGLPVRPRAGEPAARRRRLGAERRTGSARRTGWSPRSICSCARRRRPRSSTRS